MGGELSRGGKSKHSSSESLVCNGLLVSQACEGDVIGTEDDFSDSAIPDEEIVRETAFSHPDDATAGALGAEGGVVGLIGRPLEADRARTTGEAGVVILL